MSKEHATITLLNNYTNKNGHVTLKPANLSDPSNGRYDSENPNLFTGEACILFKLNNIQMNNIISNTARSISAVMVLDSEGREIKGLFSRQPDSYKSNNPVSHDEYSGLNYSFACISQFRSSLAADIVEYGKKYNYCYDDTNPRVRPSLYNPVLWFQAYMVASGRKQRKHYKLFNTATHWRQPDEVGFYKIMSEKHNPSIFELLFIALSLFLSVRKPKGSTSGKLINWYKLKALEIIGYSNFIVDLGAKYFYNRLRKDYGEEYVEELHRIYFKDKNHPFHTLCKGLK